MTSSETATGVPTATMNYANYDTGIILKYKVKLQGWPHHKLVSPYDIHTIDELRNVRDALRCGSCFWMSISSREVTQHAKDVAEREAAGEVVGKKRKERSDKGTKKGPRTTQPECEESDEEDGGSLGEGPSKRQRVSGSDKRKVMSRKAKATSRKAKGKENTATGMAKSKTKRPTQSVRAQVPPSHPFISDSDSADE